jgi:hypothetical protein
MRFLGVLIVFAGCQNGGAATPDTPAGTDDGSQHGLGMFVSWNARPALPGMVSDKLTISEATFQLNHFQIVADSGGAMHSRYLLSWSAGMAPATEVFHDAPAGVYSKATLDIGGTLLDHAYEIRGIWTDDKGASWTYKIEDESPITITIDCNQTLTGAGMAEIAIEVDLRDALGAISFKGLSTDDDSSIEISKHENQPALAAFRAKLQDAFKSDD